MEGWLSPHLSSFYFSGHLNYTSTTEDVDCNPEVQGWMLASELVALLVHCFIHNSGIFSQTFPIIFGRVRVMHFSERRKGPEVGWVLRQSIHFSNSLEWLLPGLLLLLISMISICSSVWWCSPKVVCLPSAVKRCFFMWLANNYSFFWSWKFHFSSYWGTCVKELTQVVSNVSALINTIREYIFKNYKPKFQKRILSFYFSVLKEKIGLFLLDTLYNILFFVKYLNSSLRVCLPFWPKFLFSFFLGAWDFLRS